MNPFPFCSNWCKNGMLKYSARSERFTFCIRKKNNQQKLFQKCLNSKWPTFVEKLYLTGHDIARKSKMFPTDRQRIEIKHEMKS